MWCTELETEMVAGFCLKESLCLHLQSAGGGPGNVPLLSGGSPFNPGDPVQHQV